MQRTKPRRRFRFSLRTMLMLMTLCAIVAWWGGMQVKWIRDRHSAAQADQTIEGIHYSNVALLRGTAAPWSIRIFGETGYKEVIIAVPSPLETSGGHRVLQGPAGTHEEAILTRHFKILFPEAACRVLSAG